MVLTRRRVIWGAVLAGGALALVLLLRPEPVRVETAVIARGPLRETLDEQGDTQVHDRYVVTMPVAGALERVALRAGDAVRAGAIVAWVGAAPLDPRAGGQARARLDAAEDAWRVAEAQVVAARAAVAQAERVRLRAESLAVAGLLAPQEREQADLALVARRQELAAATSAADLAAHEQEVARAALLGSAPAAGGPRRAVRAPASGRVLRVLEESARVLPAGAPILEVGDPTRLEVRAEFLSEDAARMQAGDSALVETWTGGTTLRARVRTVEPSGFTKVSALGVEEQRVAVILDFADPPGTLGDRYRVTVRVVAWSAPSVLVAPVSALFQADGAWQVMVVRGGRARRQAIEIGHRGATEVEVRAGLAPGDTVIRYPGDAVVEGARVE